MSGVTRTKLIELERVQKKAITALQDARTFYETTAREQLTSMLENITANHKQIVLLTGHLQAVGDILNRGFLGRLKFLFLGR